MALAKATYGFVVVAVTQREAPEPRCRSQYRIVVDLATYRDAFVEQSGGARIVARALCQIALSAREYPVIYSSLS